MAHEMHVFPSTRRRRRSSGSGSGSGGVRMGGVSAAFVAVCCSTLMLQVLTTTAPTPTTEPKSTSGATDLFDALLTRVGSSVRASLIGKSGDSENAVNMRLDGMRVSNVSVHRVRYVANDDSAAPSSSSDGDNEKVSDAHEEKDGANSDGDSESEGGWNGSRPEAQAQDDATESFMGRWTRKVGFLSSERKRAEVTSVVVTWDDSFRSVFGDEGDNTNNKKGTKTNGRVVTYELQHWVNGWGFDALWHPSNRKLTVADPFVVLSNLPQEHEIAFRVRMKVKNTTGLLSGLFATETDGPWSAVALLSPSRDDALEAIFVFLASNKAFFLVLLMCIGSGSLVVFKQLVSHRFLWLRRRNKRVDASNSALATTSGLDSVSSAYAAKSAVSRRSSNNGSRSAATAVGELEQEIKDLRQELADSEAEVRKLMVFRGYGVERLSPQELALVEQELRVTLQRIQKLQKSGPKSRNSSEEDTDEDEVVEPQQPQRSRSRNGSVPSRSSRNENGAGTGTGGAHARRRRLGAVFEDDDASY